MTPNDSRPVVSIIIPVFNEENRVGRSLERIFAFCNTQPYSYEVIVADDGSTDGSVNLIRDRFAKQCQLRIVQLSVHRGKGGAVQRGMLHGSGDFLIFSDADLSVPIEVLPKFLLELQRGFDVAIASRRAAGSVIEVNQDPFRKLMGNVFTSLSNFLLGLHHSDLTCGFKAFRRDAALEIFSRQRLDNWSFDSEILFLAKLKSLRVAEVAVTWRNDRATKVNLWRDVLASFLGLMAVRWNHLMRKYL